MKEKKENFKEKELMHDIQILEEIQDTTDTHTDLTEDNKTKIRRFRKRKG